MLASEPLASLSFQTKASELSNSLAMVAQSSTGFSRITEIVSLANNALVSSRGYPTGDRPPRLRKLHPQTDLNRPPPNWLKKDVRVDAVTQNPAEPFVLSSRPQAVKTELPTSSLLSSYRVDISGKAVDEFDIIAPADNLKQLFKIPYSKARVSLAVHKIGKSLVLDGLIDEEAPFEELLRQKQDRALNSQSQRMLDDSRPISSPLPRPTVAYPRTKKSSQKTLERKLYAKLLYYSISQCDDSEEFDSSSDSEDEPEFAGRKALSPITAMRGPHIATLNTGKQLASPKLAREKRPSITALPSITPALEHMKDVATNRNGEKEEEEEEEEEGNRSRIIVDDEQDKTTPDENPFRLPTLPVHFLKAFHWQFKDMNIMLGSNLLLFSTDLLPAVSLRLHSVSGRFDKATCLDYWLDNVMSNARSLAICYHDNGIVKGYRLINTEEIPHLIKGYTFHPHVVEQCAYSLLQFLQVNCTKDFGTYWLLKEAGSDAIKLYDLSVLCERVDTQDNLFSYPVAMLCYRMAVKLVASHSSPDNIVRARALFEKCAELLPQDEHPELWANTAEQLADTYLSPTPPPQPKGPPVLLLEYPNHKPETNFFGEETQYYPESAERDYTNAVQQLLEGIAVLESHSKSSNVKQLNFMKRKLSKCYYILAKICKQYNKLGAGLYCVEKAAHYYGNSAEPSSEDEFFIGKLFVLFGDMYFQIPRVLKPTDLPHHQQQTGFVPGKEPMQKEEPLLGLPVITEVLTLDPEVNLRTARMAYQRAAQVITQEEYGAKPEYRFLMKRIGNVQNELGVLYMNTQRASKAVFCFQLGIEAFKSVNDKANVALLNCNLGHLMRINAANQRSVSAASQQQQAKKGVKQQQQKGHEVKPSLSPGGMTPMEEEYFQKAIHFYEEALSAVHWHPVSAKDAEKEAELLQKVTLNIHKELAGTYLSLAHRLGEGRPIVASVKQGRMADEKEIDEMIVDNMLKALHYYEKCNDHFQAGMTHFHLGRFLSKRCELPGQEGLAARIGGGHKKHPSILDLAVQYLQKSLSIFTSQDYPTDFISIHLEIARVYNHSVYGNKENNILASLYHVVEARKGLQVRERQEEAAKEKQKEKEKESRQRGEKEELQRKVQDAAQALLSTQKCASLVEAELSQQLKDLIKFYANNKETSEDPDRAAKESMAKEIYRTFLNEKRGQARISAIAEKIAPLVKKLHT